MEPVGNVKAMTFKGVTNRISRKYLLFINTLDLN